MKNAFINLGIFLVSLFVCLLAAELGLRYFAPQNIVGSWRVTAPAGYVLNKSSGTARHEKCERSVNYEFFYPHLRGTPIKTAGKRVLTLGDSFTFGWLLNKDSVFVSVLQGLADKEFGPGEFAFLNAGTPGYGTAHYVRFVEDFGTIIQPDVVLVFLNTDDIGRSLAAGLYELQDNEVKTVAGSHHPTTAQEIKSVLNSFSGYHRLLESSHLVQVIRRAFLSGNFRTACAGSEKLSPGDPIPIPEHSGADADLKGSVELGQALFRRLRDWCSENDVELLVVTTGWFAFGDKDPTDPTNAFLDTAEEFFSAENIPFFDPTNILETQREMPTHSFCRVTAIQMREARVLLQIPYGAGFAWNWPTTRRYGIVSPLRRRSSMARIASRFSKGTNL